MSNENTSDIPSRLLSKVARGIEFPLSERHRTFDGKEFLSANDGGWAKYHRAMTSNDTSLHLDVPTASGVESIQDEMGEGVEERRQEGEVPVADLQASSTLDSNAFNQSYPLNDVHENVTHLKKHFDESGISDNTVPRDQKDNLNDGFYASLSDINEYKITSLQDRESGLASEAGTNAEGNSVRQENFSSVQNEDVERRDEHIYENELKDIHFYQEKIAGLIKGFTASLSNNIESETPDQESRESWPSSKEHVTDETAVDNKKIQMGGSTFQHLNAGDFSSQKRHSKHSVLKSLFSIPNTDIRSKSYAREIGSDESTTKELSHKVKPLGEPVDSVKIDAEKSQFKDIGMTLNESEQANINSPLRNKVALKDTVLESKKKSFRKDSLTDKSVTTSHDKVLLKRARDNFSENLKLVKRPVLKGGNILSKKDSRSLGNNQGNKNGSVKIGQLNIHVRGREKAEEEKWPDAPDYKDHIITDDWEWSCLYGWQE